MAEPLRVLIVEDRATDAELVVDQLREAGFDPVWDRVQTEMDYLARLSPDLDVILSDHRMPQFDSTTALRLLQETGLDIPFILVSSGFRYETRSRRLSAQGSFDSIGRRCPASDPSEAVARRTAAG
jgi:CheY-like chemotaxis protein